MLHFQVILPTNLVGVAEEPNHGAGSTSADGVQVELHGSVVGTRNQVPTH